VSKSRKLLLTTVALFAGASGALAADLPTMKGPPPAPAPVPYSWTGPNIGVQAGYGWGQESDDLSATQFNIIADHFAANGAIGGAHIGYDQQFGSLVLGVYGELDASGMQGDKNVTQGCLTEGCVVTNSSLAFRNTWQAFLLGRAGVAFDRLLIYAVGGLAIGDDRESLDFTRARVTSPPAQNVLGVWTGSQTRTLLGGAVGLGAEYAFDQHWRAGAEWRYADFGKAGYSAVSGGAGLPVNYKAGFSENLALIDLSYAF
jgi:outer membrane immunogenic protein